MSLIQIPLHIFGVWIVVMRTPKTMGKVKFSMLLLHLTCCLFDLLITIGTIPFVIFPIAAGYPLGIMWYMGVPTAAMVYIVFTSLFFLGPAIVMFFENRYNHLVRVDSETQSRKKKRALHYFFNYFCAFITFIPPFFEMPDQNESRLIARQRLPCLPTEIIDNPRFFMIGNERLLGYCALSFMAVVWGQAILFFCLTASYLFRAKVQSERTSHLQKQFFIAICIQISLPFFIITIPAAYVISTLFTGNLDMILSNFSLVWATCHGLFSNVIMVLVHKPYRDVTLKLLGLEKVQVINPLQAFKTSRVSTYT